MQVNRYSKVLEAPITNTYVPINFGELYRIGAAQKQAVDEAAQQFGAQLQKFGEFRSPSSVDTQKWYDLTINRSDVQDAIQKMVTNPDYLKDAANRSYLQQLINSVDYATLSNLKQSREGLLARQKANQELMLKGLYNPLWHDIDFSNYDTSRSGIFNDVSPLAYKSEVDLVRPYVDNLKASFMGTKNGWIHQGVSTNRTDYEIQENLSSIQNTPEYQKHLEVLQRQGLSRSAAEEQLNRTLITAGREFAYDQAQRDPWWMKSAELQAKYANKQNMGSLLNLTEQVHMDGKYRIYENFTDMTPKEMNAVARKGIDVLPKDRRKQVEEQLDPHYIRYRLRNSFDEVYRKSRSLNAGTDYVLNTLSSPLDPIIATNTYAAYGTTGVKDKNGNYHGKKSNEFILQDELAFSIMGKGSRDGLQTTRNHIFTDMWNNGDFHDFIIMPDTKQITDGSRVYHAKYAYVPIDQFNNSDFYEAKGKTEDEKAKSLYDAIQEAGLKVTTLDDSQQDGSVVVRLDNRDNIDSKSITTKNSKKYVMVPVTTVIPSSGQAARAADISLINAQKLGTEMNFTQNARSELMRFPYSNLDDDN